jgi:hypothetical protein
VRKFYKKLTNYYLGSFKISEKINDNVYKLKLPNQYGRLNDFFYISLLNFYVRKVDKESPNPILIDKDDRFLIDYLLDERIFKKKINI